MWKFACLPVIYRKIAVREHSTIKQVTVRRLQFIYDADLDSCRHVNFFSPRKGLLLNVNEIAKVENKEGNLYSTEK
jgi:hypothetical protein